MKPRHGIAIALAICAIWSGSVRAESADKQAGEDIAARYPVPVLFVGFRGTLRGKVVSVKDHMHGFVLKVNAVSQVDASSTAPDAQSAIGRELAITASAKKDGNGNWVSDGREMNYIQGLQVDQEIEINVFVPDKIHVRIGTLTTPEQQQAHEEGKKEKEKK
ncbi:MAG TPA: hypothetical protein VFE58_05575 [Tepidisphaeraceae bacterium]|jgi:hypothetical protein|nr:hypothetical protein [Tepidisphaeraceae bacterium]